MATQQTVAPVVDVRLEPVEETAPLVQRPVQMRPPAQQQAAATVADAAAVPLSYRHSDSFAQLAMALAAAQGEFTEIEKALTATVTSKREGARSYTYNYADLATVLKAVRPALSKHGLAVLQMPSVRRGGIVLTTLLTHGQSGEWFAGDLVVALENMDPQAIGSATTYARRYGLTALLGVAAGEADDDGASAMKPPRETVQAPEGFDGWWTDLEACADNGADALDAAWQASTGDRKNYVTKHLREKWNALKAKAAAVQA